MYRIMGATCGYKVQMSVPILGAVPDLMDGQKPDKGADKQHRQYERHDEALKEYIRNGASLHVIFASLPMLVYT